MKTEAPATQPPPAQTAPSGAWDFFRWLIGTAISLVFIAATVMAFYNVFGSTIEVDRLARETACQGQSSSCKAQFTFWERTPIAHTLQMFTPGGDRTITCKREYI